MLFTIDLWIAAVCIWAFAEHNVSGQGTFIPSKDVPPVWTPGAAAGVTDGRSGFTNIKQMHGATKWMQTIDGIPVYGSVLCTHNNEQGMISQVQGFVSQTASLVDPLPVVNASDALETIKNKWNHSSSNLSITAEEPKLNILVGGNGWDKLVWKVEYHVDYQNFARRESNVGPVPANIHGMVNAHTGELEKTWDDIESATTVISAITGNENIGEDFVDIRVQSNAAATTCRHYDRSRRIEVFDIWNRRQVSWLSTSSFQCDRADDKNWDLFKETGGYSPRNEVYIHASLLVDLWREFVDHGPHRTPSSVLRFYVHYDHEYENAFFDGQTFKFGDGKSIFYPLTSLDIVCHEIGHAITHWHGGRMEYKGESGGINEAYSDILGETCDIHYKNRTDGLIGTDIMRKGNFLGTSMRSMCDPKSIGGAIDHMKDYRNGIDVHHSSGIYNKAWCLLKNKWNYIQAFEVFTTANLMYWNPTSTMHCGACGVESAAVDRGYPKDDVTDVFNAVGVSCSACQAAM